MRSIVVGVRGAHALDPALDFALEEAVRRRLPLEAVHCTDARGAGPSAQDELATALAHAARRVPGGQTVAARPIVREGPVAQCLSSLASPAALLVVGRGERGGLAADILRRSWAPVAVVPHSSPKVGDRWMRSRVIVGVDGSAASTSALLWAAAQAQEWDSVLAPVVVSSGAGLPPAALTRHTANLNAALWKAVREAGGSALEVHPRFLEGSAAQAILSLAEPEDLLVLGSRGRPGGGRVSQAVTELAQGPVVVIREGQSRRETHQRSKRALVSLRSPWGGPSVGSGRTFGTGTDRGTPRTLRT